MAYSIYLGDVLLPVTPAKVSTKIKNQNRTINLINEGEVNLLKAAGLTEISFSCLIPQTQYPFAVYPDGFRPAAFYLGELERLKTEKKPFQFICSRTTPGGELLFDTNLKVSLEDYQITEDAREGLDLTVAVNLKQYREAGAKLVSIIEAATETPTAVVEETRPAETAPAPKTYTVLLDDTLWIIAKKTLGDGGRYGEIAALNNIGNPNDLRAGQVLTLPA